MMRPKKKLILFVILPLLFTLSLTAFFKLRSARPEAFAKVTRGKIMEAVYGIGTVTSNKVHSVKVNQAGSIGKVFVREGDLVKKGAKLLVFEGIPFFAPFEGTVISIPYKMGETVFPQVPLLTMRDQSDLYIIVSLEQQGALKVKPGQRAYISFDSMREKRFEGKVRAVFSNENQFLVHIDIEHLPSEILPGMSTDVGIVISEKENVLLVPVVALNGDKLRTLQNGELLEIPVKIGNIDSEMAEIESDRVKEGQTLTLGTPVKK